MNTESEEINAHDLPETTAVEVVDKIRGMAYEIRMDWSDPRTECRAIFRLCDSLKGMLSNEQNDKRSDATEADSSNAVGEQKEIQRLKELLNQVVRASEETRLILCGYDEEEAKIKSAEVWEQFKIDKKL